MELKPNETAHGFRISSREELPEILDAVDIPCVVIGGGNAKSIPTYAGLPLAGYAVVSAIVAADDVRASAAELKALALANTTTLGTQS